MHRLLALLMIFALSFTNGPAVAMAMCQHEDARAHAAALKSSDTGVSVSAQGEEAAARSASQAALGDAAMTLLAGFILPADLLSFPLRVVEPATTHAADLSGLAGRSVPPLLEPPLA